MEEAFADWDLLAVVRSCSTTTTTTSPPPPPPPPPSSPSSELLFGLPTLFEPTTTSLQDDNSNNTTPKFQSFSSSSSSSVSSSLTPSVSSSSFGIGELPLLRRLVRPSQVVFGPPNTGSNNPQQPQRTKKRKNLIKKVCHVPAEGLSNDMWAWRKYGQKPIKGSPYPRGYYRCSSSKGCLARKQVERNRSDPKMFIVTYTAEHNHPMPTHRNSLAGSTRQKTIASTATGDATQSDQATTCSSPSAASLSSPTTEKSESKADGDDLMMELDDDSDMGLSDLMLNDDFYVGFEKIDGEDTDDCFSDHFSPPMEFPWLTNSSPSGTATAAGGI